MLFWGRNKNTPSPEIDLEPHSKQTTPQHQQGIGQFQYSLIYPDRCEAALVQQAQVHSLVCSSMGNLT
jgi:hypothetical protein